MKSEIFVIDNDKIVKRKIHRIVVEGKDNSYTGRGDTQYIQDCFLTREEAEDSLKTRLIQQKKEIERKLNEL